jgi:hypothetical protein
MLQWICHFLGYPERRKQGKKLRKQMHRNCNELLHFADLVSKIFSLQKNKEYKCAFL